MTQTEKARSFADLHVKGDPLVLYNIWDAGSARAVRDAGAAALATGSWSVAAAQGFDDGEAIPLALVETIVRRITASVDLPLTVDFEGGYAEDAERVASNVERIIKAGAVGVNFEDRIVGKSGLYGVEQQSRRIRALRRKADDLGVPLFINARTDLFLAASDPSEHAALIAGAEERAAAYAEAGASGFFAPGLANEELVARLCKASAIPVNIMVMSGAPSVERLAELGVARISYGPIPYAATMAALKDLARAAHASAPHV